MRRFLILQAFCLLYISPAYGEYRAYLMDLINEEQKPIRKIQSALDPDQYSTYHPLLANQQLVLVDTWMCYGSTKHKDICPKPSLEKPKSLQEDEVTP